MADPFAWAPRIDWSNSVKVTREFKTDIITSRSGKEQRRALRNTPRRSLEFTVTEQGDLARYLHLDLSLMRAQQVALPDPITADLTVKGRLTQDTSATWPTNDSMQVDAHFNIDPASEAAADIPDAPATFNGRELFLVRPNWAQSVSLTYSQPYELLDKGWGRTAYYDPIAFLTRTVQSTFVGMDVDHMTAIETNFIRAKGRRGEFYMPTWRNDVPLAADIAASDTHVLTSVGLVGVAYDKDTVFKALLIVAADGTQIARKITGMLSQDDGTHIALDSAIGMNLAKTDVVMISWLPVWRHASDSITSEWLTNRVGQVQLTMQSIEDLPVAV